MWDFFNSNFFVGLVTFIVGLVAIIIYFIQKSDQKKDAANIILLEIKSAERAIKRIKANLLKNELASNIFVLPSDSWSKYKYLFVRDFDRDEWDSITDFYNGCILLDDDVKYNNSAFWSDVQEIRANKQNVLADFTKRVVEEIHKDSNPTKRAAIILKFKENTELFDELYMERQSRFAYSPNKPLNDAKLHIQSIQENLSQTAVGEKFKKFAKI